MSNFEAANFTEKSSDNFTKSSQLNESIHGQLTTEDFKKHLINKVKPDACIRDQDGFIACGPIVGYERPEPASSEVLAPIKPKPSPWHTLPREPEGPKKELNTYHRY